MASDSNKDAISVGKLLTYWSIKLQPLQYKYTNTFYNTVNKLVTTWVNWSFEQYTLFLTHSMYLRFDTLPISILNY